MAVIGLRAQVMKSFFDRGAVMKVLNAQERRYMARSGAYVMTTARRSMRKVAKAKKIERAGKTPRQFAEAIKAERYRRASKPGQPPRYRTGGIRKNTFFAFDGPRGGVVIGPARFASAGQMVPKVLEEGGTITRKLKSGRRVRDQIKPRPYMAPALRQTIPKVRGFIRDATRGR